MLIYLLIDFAMLGCIGFYVQRGLKIGILWELASLAGLLFVICLSGAISFVLGHFIFLAPYIEYYLQMLENYTTVRFGMVFSIAQWNYILLFLFSFVLIYGFYFLKRPMESWAKKLPFSYPLAKTLGGIFGFVKAMIILYIVYNIFQIPFFPKGDVFISQTAFRFMGAFEGLFNSLLTFLGFR